MDPYYDLSPKVIAPGESVAFTIRSRYEPGILKPGSHMILRILSLNDYRISREIPVSVNDDCQILFSFEAEISGEYHLSLYSEEHPENQVVVLPFFAVCREWLKMRPYKGDLHMHTFHSDGNQSPAYMAAHGRSAGFDFAAVTDHRLYEPSLEAIEKAEELEMDILLFPGEEVNYYLGLGHILSINAGRSIADSVRGKEYSDRELVERIAGEVGEVLDRMELLPETDRNLFGYYYGIVKRIHEAGGFAVAAHPFWISHNTYDLARKTYEQVLESGIFDAVEVFGGQGFEENILSLSRINQHQRKKGDIPVIGNSDAHNASNDEVGRIMTIVFAESLSREGILDAIRECRTIPCLYSGKEGQPVAAGPTELVEYSYFLLREFFPRHDEICRVLGELYKASLRTGHTFDSVGILQRELQGYYDQYFAEI